MRAAHEVAEAIRTKKEVKARGEVGGAAGTPAVRRGVVMELRRFAPRPQNTNHFFSSNLEETLRPEPHVCNSCFFFSSPSFFSFSSSIPYFLGLVRISAERCKAGGSACFSPPPPSSVSRPPSAPPNSPPHTHARTCTVADQTFCQNSRDDRLLTSG